MRRNIHQALACLCITAGILTPAAQAQTPETLSREDVSALLASRAIDINFPNGAGLSMTNATGGSLASFMWHASPKSRMAVRSAPGAGSWNIADDGRYCLKAGWRIGNDLTQLATCRTVTPTGDNSYLLKAGDGQPDWTMHLKD
jgi:hypothetical protein